MSAQKLTGFERLPDRRKSSWCAALLSALLIAGAVSSASARLVCARILLPGLADTNTICLVAGDGQPDAFLRVSLSGVPDGFTVSNGLHRGWTLAYPGAVSPEAACPVRMHYSLGALPSGLSHTNWDRVNYLLNHKKGTADEMQAALWQLLGGPASPDDSRFSPPSETTLNLIADAHANGPGFIPQSGQVAAVILDSSPAGPAVILEVQTVPDRMPVAGPDAFSVSQGSSLQLLPPQLLVNDVDPDGDPLVLVDVSTNSARGGIVTFDGTTLVYLPPPGLVGADSFAYGLAAGACGRAIGTVTLDVTPAPNGQPIPRDDTAATERGQPLTLPASTLLANDADPDGDTLAILAVSTNSARGGTVVLDGAQVLYTPPPGFVGTDTFTYTVSDGRGGVATATVAITVAPPPNQAPVALGDEISTDEDLALVVPVGTLLANDKDPDGDALHVIAVNADSSQGGTVALVGTNVVYTPPAGFEGMDTFTYTISDGRGGTSTASVTVTVRPVNRAPLAGVLRIVTLMNTPVNISLNRIMELASDPDGDVLHLVGISPNSSAGGLAVLGVSDLQYTPRRAHLGADTFTFVVQDPSGARGTGAVNIVINAATLGVGLGDPVHNPQTGLFEQRVTVSNLGDLTLAALRLDITGLPTNVVVWNATGTNDGIPFIQYNRALDPGQSVVVRIEYYVPDRRPFTPVITVTPTAAAAPKPASGAEGVAIDRSYMDTRLPGEPRYVIEFTSTPGRIYTIIYSDDMKTWKTAVPAVTASANRTQWYDDGPPKTDNRPADQGTRFYRVIESP